MRNNKYCRILVAVNDQRSGSAAPSATAAQVDAVMLAAQVLVGVTAQSVADVEDIVTLPQLRVLVLIADRGQLNLNAVAQAMQVHPSNATRLCDRLVAAGLIDRRDAAGDRRNIALSLTGAGRDLVASMTRQRRSAIADVLEQMPDVRRRGLVLAMRAFADAAGESAQDRAWSLGWNA